MKKGLFGKQISVFIWTVVITALLGVGIHYLILPPMNFQSSGFWWFIAMMLFIAFIISLFFKEVFCPSSKNSRMKNDKISLKSNIIPTKNDITPIFFDALLIWMVVLFLTSIGGWKMLKWEEYHNLISIENGAFEEEIIDANSSEDIISVDVETASKLGDRTIGAIQNASWFEVDNEYNLISYNGEEYRLSPLEYGGFWKARKANANDGIPGYVLVNAKTQEAVFVEKKGIKYSPSAYFEYDLYRHLYNQYPTYIFGKSFFEIDDNGEPYWITPVKEATIGMRGGRVNKAVVICNAITGECQEYKVDEVPEWVDHVHSVGDLMELIGWHYQYGNGFWNFSKTNVFRTAYSYYESGGYNSVVSKDGEVLFVTTITPANNAETIIGFVAANSRTGNVRFYEVTGAEESSAQAAAEGLVQNLNYVAGFPVIINIDGVETYFMVLKDNAGLVRKYALCNVEDYSKCVEADTIDSVIDKYKVAIGLKDAGDMASAVVGNEESVNQETIEMNGVITDVKEAQIGGYTYYYFTIDGSDIVFMSSIQNSNMQPMKLVVGANVAIKYYTSTEAGIGIVKEIKF